MSRGRGLPGESVLEDMLESEQILQRRNDDQEAPMQMYLALQMIYKKFQHLITIAGIEDE